MGCFVSEKMHISLLKDYCNFTFYILTYVYTYNKIIINFIIKSSSRVSIDRTFSIGYSYRAQNNGHLSQVIF